MTLTATSSLDRPSRLAPRRNLLLHFLCWGIVIFLPLLLYRPADSWDVRWSHFLRGMGGTLGYMIVFYVNYVWLIPRLFFSHRKWAFALCNVALIAMVIAFTMEWWQVVGDLLNLESPKPGMPRRPLILLIFQSVVMLGLVVSLSMAVRMVQRWQHVEAARREAERRRTESELSNLRNQLNPHFLLNTLNNIYALIAFAPEKAQTAVEELSKLLRHVLYDNRSNFVPLYKEAAFMRNYIELMRIRMTEGVKIDVDIDIAPDDATPVAPMLFISLVENAFKHGISSDGEGYIKVALKQNDGSIMCDITNSNHPKQSSDKSGHGIGLEQVQRRLDLMYPDRYQWTRGATDDGKQYNSCITLKTK